MQVLFVAWCQATCKLRIHEVLDFGRQSTWTMDSIIVQSAAADSFHAALGLSNNSVLISPAFRQDEAHPCVSVGPLHCFAWLLLVSTDLYGAVLKNPGNGLIHRPCSKCIEAALRGLCRALHVIA